MSRRTSRRLLSAKIRIAARRRTLTAVITRDGRKWIAHCPEFDVASQGSTVDRAKTNLVEAVGLFIECAGPAEIARRDGGDMIVSRFVVNVR